MATSLVNQLLRPQCRSVLIAFFGGGGKIDTANIYTEGTSEKFVGELLNGIRSQIVVATKYSSNPYFPGSQVS